MKKITKSPTLEGNHNDHQVELLCEWLIQGPKP